MNTENSRGRDEGALLHKNILLGVCGGIAAYKSVYLARLLTQAGASVQVVMTAAAGRFIGEQTFQAVTGRAVRQDLWDKNAEAAMGHIELARWADLILIAPATAETMARLRNGNASDLLSTLHLASHAPLLLAPAMNQAMWRHPATQENVAVLRQRNVNFCGPAEGDQACGDVGPGRMAEPQDIMQAVAHVLATRAPSGVTAEVAANSAMPDTATAQVLSGRQVLITAGPTYEDIDPVRFIGNRSSGRMGYALAAAAAELGADVTLVSGPVHLATPAGVHRVDVRTAREMHDAVLARVEECTVFIAAAAVADYRVANPAEHKMKKRYQEDAAAGMMLELVANPDILAQVASLPQRPYCVGFAAETEHLREHAEAKRRRKGVDLIAANWVGEGRGFDTEQNALLILGEGFEESLPQADKNTLARQLLAIVATRLDAATKKTNRG